MKIPRTQVMALRNLYNGNPLTDDDRANLCTLIEDLAQVTPYVKRTQKETEIDRNRLKHFLDTNGFNSLRT